MKGVTKEEKGVLESQAILHRMLGQVVGSLTVTGDDVVKLHTPTKMKDWAYTALQEYLTNALNRPIKVIRGRFYKKQSPNGHPYVTTTKEK